MIRQSKSFLIICLLLLFGCFSTHSFAQSGDKKSSDKKEKKHSRKQKTLENDLEESAEVIALTTEANSLMHDFDTLSDVVTDTIASYGEVYPGTLILYRKDGKIIKARIFAKNAVVENNVDYYLKNNELIAMKQIGKTLYYDSGLTPDGNEPKPQYRTNTVIGYYKNNVRLKMIKMDGEVLLTPAQNTTFINQYKDIRTHLKNQRIH